MWCNSGLHGNLGVPWLQTSFSERLSQEICYSKGKVDIRAWTHQADRLSWDLLWKEDSIALIKYLCATLEFFSQRFRHMGSTKILTLSFTSIVKNNLLTYLRESCIHLVTSQMAQVKVRSMQFHRGLLCGLQRSRSTDLFSLLSQVH